MSNDFKDFIYGAVRGLIVLVVVWAIGGPGWAACGFGLLASFNAKLGLGE